MQARTSRAWRIAAAAGLATSTAVCSADVYFDRTSFENDNPGLTTENFEGIAPPNQCVSAPAFPGFVFDAAVDQVLICDEAVGPRPSDTAAIAIADDIMYIDFVPNVSVAGLNIGATDFNDVFNPYEATVLVFDANNNLLESQTFQTAGMASMSTFIGFSNLGADIARIEFRPQPGGLGDIDNLSYPIIENPFTMDWFTIDGGVEETAAGAGYALNASAGQPDAMVQHMSGGGYNLLGGFWSNFGDADQGCEADIDGDGDADADDFFAFLDAFAAGNQAICDVDGDGDCDADDFFGYLDAFSQGC